MITGYDLYQQPGWVLFGLFVVAIWVLIWKGIGLWHAAKNEQKGWFLAILIFNTLGLLPIIYLLWFKTKKEEELVEDDITEEFSNVTEKEVKESNKPITKNKPTKSKVNKKKMSPKKD